MRGEPRLLEQHAERGANRAVLVLNVAPNRRASDDPPKTPTLRSQIQRKVSMAAPFRLHTMKTKNVLFASALITLQLACGAAQRGDGGAVPDVTGASAVPASTVFQMSANESMAGGPTSPEAKVNVYVESYRIEHDGKGFVVTKLMSDGSRGGSTPVATAQVANLVELAKRHRANLHCVAGSGRASYIARRLQVSGPVDITVQSDCQGMYPSEAPNNAPEEYRRFHDSFDKLVDAIQKVAESPIGPKAESPAAK